MHMSKVPWIKVGDVVGSSVLAGALTALTSFQQDGYATPWQKHAVVGGIAALAALASHLRRSPLPRRPAPPPLPIPPQRP
jgi:hypothetical protein